MKELMRERREAYVEVLEILDNMDTYYKEKIPLNLRKYFKDNASTEYEFNIDFSKPFEENNLKEITKNVLAMLNLNYWCENEEEKQKWKNIYDKNEKKHEEMLNQKYNIEDVFEKRREHMLKKCEEEIVEEEFPLDIVEYEKTLLEKIINKIKSFFHKY